MKKILWMSVGLALVMALSALPPSCQNQNTPTTDPSATIATSDVLTVPETTPIETTIESTTAETTTETAPVETTAETTIVETTAPSETTAEPTETVAPTQATATPTTPPAETTVAPSETPLVKTVYATGSVNIRSGPGTTYGKVRTVTAGTPLNVVALTANNWYRLDDSTYVSPSVVSDIMPTPTPAPTPSPTPDPNATPTPTPGAVVTYTSAEATALAKSVVTSVRAANGLTTNYASVLDTRCYLSASRFVLDHSIPNGTLESAGGIVDSGSQWISGPDVYNSLEEAILDTTRYLIVTHVADMAVSAEYTEFGVGVAKNVYLNPWGGTEIEYYIYISCTDPDHLQGQIDAGWYD